MSTQSTHSKPLCHCPASCSYLHVLSHIILLSSWFCWLICLSFSLDLFMINLIFYLQFFTRWSSLLSGILRHACEATVLLFHAICSIPHGHWSARNEACGNSVGMIVSHCSIGIITLSTLWQFLMDAVCIQFYPKYNNIDPWDVQEIVK